MDRAASIEKVKSMIKSDKMPETINEIIFYVSGLTDIVNFKTTVKKIHEIIVELKSIKDRPEFHENCSIDFKINNPEYYLDRVKNAVKIDQKLLEENLQLNINSLNALPINHGNGTKYVFKKGINLENNLTQIAFGVFSPGQSCDVHKHETMDEYFYFISGKGIYIVEDDTFFVKSGMFLEIKSGLKHQLFADGIENLEFVYWGIAK